MMKRLFISLFGLLLGTSFAAEPPCCVEQYVAASISAEYNNFRPMCLFYQRAGIPDWNSFGLNIGAKKITRGAFSAQPKIGFTYGGVNFNNLQESVELTYEQVAEPNPKTANYNARSSRSSFFGGVQFGRTFGCRQLFALEIPVFLNVRYISHEGYFVDTDNRIVQGDLVGNDTYNGNFGQKVQVGFQSGLEAVLFPMRMISIYTRFNFNYFKQREVYNVAGTGLDLATGNIYIPTETVKATGNYGFAVGIRVNFMGYK